MEKLVQKYGDGNLSIVQANVKGGVPVYVYGGGSNKTLYGVLFEADKSVIETNPTATPEPTPREPKLLCLIQILCRL